MKRAQNMGSRVRVRVPAPLPTIVSHQEATGQSEGQLAWHEAGVGRVGEKGQWSETRQSEYDSSYVAMGKPVNLCTSTSSFGKGG